MMHVRRYATPLFALVLTAVSLPALAADVSDRAGNTPARQRWPITFAGDDRAAVRVRLHATFAPDPLSAIDDGPRPDAFDPVQATATSPPPVAFEYSHGYEVRNRIHHLASYTMLPLFGAEAWIGQQLFNHPDQITPAKRHFHGAIALAIGGLFGVNSVTGVWNLMEARKDPNLGLLPTIHGVLMLVADAGFVATAFTRPNSRTAAGLAVYDPKKNQHLALAYASISTATVGYVMMLFRH